jgi:transposase-like protein
MEKLKRCPFCGCPLRENYRSNEEVRYRCSVCGKQTIQKLPKKQAVEEVVVDSGAVEGK